MSDESRLRAEYLASDYPSGSAGYRRFFVDRITSSEQQFAQARDHVIEQERGIVGRERRIAELEAENERLENLLAEGVHSCSKTCKRPMCVLRRENQSLEKQLSDKDKLLKHCKALLDHCTYHDGRYEQCANSEYQNNCCDTSDMIEVALKERDSGS